MDESPERWTWPLAYRAPGSPPGPGAPGSFGAVRRFDVHTGVDLYCPEGAIVRAVEGGTVVAVEDFTGPAAGSPWWLPTRAVLVEGRRGVVLYGEIAERVRVGAALRPGEALGAVLRVLRHDKGRPTTMLHLELYRPGTRASVWWPHGSERPEALLDPTAWLVAAAASSV